MQLKRCVVCTCCRTRPRGCCMPSPPFVSGLASLLPSSLASLPPCCSSPCSACSKRRAPLPQPLIYREDTTSSCHQHDVSTQPNLPVALSPQPK